MPDLVRLREVLGRSELERFVSRLRRRLEQGKPLTGVMSLSQVAPEERDAINRLLRRRPSGGDSISVPLERLEESLRRAGICQTLAEAVEALTGPVANRSAEREREEKAWEALFATAYETFATRPELIEWLHQLRALGLLRRHGLEHGSRLLSQAREVLARLPAQGIPLAELAASVVGNAHALDTGKPLGSLVLRAAALLGQIERWDDSDSRRDTWSSVGVLQDELSAPVAVLNLRAGDDSACGRFLNLHADAAEPYFLTIRQLLRTPPQFHPAVTGPVVYIFENKNILGAAANRLGPTSPPIITTDGQPKTAVRVLMKQLGAAGIRLRYHGDFDWPGIQMANTMATQYGAEIWRMTAADYRNAVAGNLKLAGPVVVPIWDEELFAAMQEKGIALHEEQVLDVLIRELMKGVFEQTD